MKNILLFGTGSGLKDILSIIPKEITILALCDNDINKQNTSLYGHQIISPNQILNYDFNYIIITSQATDAIKNQLIKIGINEFKILCLNPGNNSQIHLQANKDINILNNELGFNIPEIGFSTMYLWPNTLDNNTSKGDNVRYLTLKLVSEQIISKKLNGSIAELGVFQGDFAVQLNTLFNDKKLYLFDTFEGFSSKDLILEDKNNFSVSSTTDFSNTNEKLVLQRMPYKENVILCKGFFPETTTNIEDEFCFVSIDVDLYAPTLAGLEYFYPRLVKGGYIFIHDYNSKRYQGVKNIVDDFVLKNGAILMPIPDFAGTVVILK